MFVIPKSETEQIQISAKEYKGFPYVDIRVFFKAETGEYLPTKKGVTISPKHVPDFIAAIQEIQKEW